MARKLELDLFGGFEARVDGAPAGRFEAATARGLLAYLALQPRRPLGRDLLARIFWGLDAGPTGLTNLRSALRRVRAALGDEGHAQPFLMVERETVQLNPAAELLVDVRRFEEALNAVRSHAHVTLDECDSCQQWLRQAADLYRGPFLEDLQIPSVLFQEWQRTQDERLHRLGIQTLHQLASLNLRRGNLADAEQDVRRQLELEIWNEEAHRQLMRVLNAMGQRSAALAQYPLCQQVLLEELGVPTSAETDALYAQIVAGSGPPMPHSIANPYKGLAAFGVGDASFFFGRTAITERLLDTVSSQPLVALIGPSGSGKSSVIHAGLVARLIGADGGEGRFHQPGGRSAGPRWLVASLRPGSDPFAALAAAVSPLLLPRSVDLQHGHAFRTGALTLDSLPTLLTLPAARDAGARPRLLVIVDQFEEMFTLCRDGAERAAFIDLLLTNLQAAVHPSRLVVLLSMRADFLPQALQHRGMADVLQDHTVILGPLYRSEMQRAIQEPAERQGVSLEAGLVERLMDDVGDEPGSLPLLQFALALLWQARTDDGRLTHAAYVAIEGVRGALTHYAEGVFTRLQPHEQAEAGRIFLALVQPGQDAPDVRRTATRAELGEGQWPLVQRLADARLVVTNQGPGGEETAELAHEALIREWHRLKEWLEGDRAFQTWQQRMRSGAEQWLGSGEDEDGLLQGARLVEAERWRAERSAELGPAVAAYLDASIALREERQRIVEAQRQRELAQARAVAEAEHRRAEVEANARRRLRRLTFGVMAATLLAVIAALLGFQAQRTAEANAQLALTRQLSAQALNEMDSEIDLALLLDQEAQHLSTDARDQADLLSEFDIDPLLTQTLYGPPVPLYHLTFDPANGQVLASNEQGAIVAWDLETGQVEQVISATGSIPAGTSVSTRGDRFVTSITSTLTLWDATTLVPVSTLEGHTASVTMADFTPDGNRIVSSDEDGQVYLWDASDGARLAHFRLAPEHSPLGVVNNDGTSVLTDLSSTENIFYLVDLARSTVSGEALVGHTDGLHGFAVSPDGGLLATASFDGTIRIWDAQTGATLGPPLLGHEGRVLFVTFSPDGRMLASGGTDKQVLLWEVPGGKPIGAPLRGHANWVRAGQFSADGRSLATGDASGKVLLWDLSRQHFLEGHTDRVRSVAVSPDGATLVTSGFDKRLIVWDTARLREQRVIATEHSHAIIEIAFSPDGETLASIDAGGGVIFWETATWTPRFPLHVGRDSVLIGLDFSPDSRTLVTGAFDGAFQPWDVATGQPSHSPVDAHQGWALSVRFSPDGSQLATGGQDGAVRFWETTDWTAQGHTIAAHGNWVTDLLFAPDGRTLVSSSADGTIRFWSVATGQPDGEALRGHRAQVWGLHLDDGQGTPRLVSLGGDGGIMWWDWASRQLLQPPWRTRRETERMAVSPDGRRIYLASFGAEAMALEVADEPWPQRACHIANRNLTPEEWRHYLHDLPYAQTCPLPEPDAQ